ncbi:MAG TPA: hypothetical protein VGP13_00110 [Candidatus Paceibacterota bacterium]|jgi:hypothetical protein|nr:hypothetical protein [Candidatus Paceibacterota bacterium]
MKKTILIATSFFALPLVAFAQNAGNLSALQDLVKNVGVIVNTLIPILIGVALVVFFVGLVKYLWGAGGTTDHTSGRQTMIWGLVTLFVMVSVWGIVRLAQNALLGNAYGNNTSIQAPYAPTNFQGPTNTYGGGSSQ